MPRCAIRAPFGLPLDPDVYITYARSEGVAPQGAPSPAPAGEAPPKTSATSTTRLPVRRSRAARPAPARTSDASESRTMNDRRVGG